MLLAAVLLGLRILRPAGPGPESGPRFREVGSEQGVAAPVEPVERAEVLAEDVDTSLAGAADAVASGDAPVPDGKLRVRGVVVDLAWPPRGWPEERPVGLEVTVQGFDGQEYRLPTGAGGRFELLAEDPGERPLLVLAIAPGDDRYAMAPVHQELGQGERSVDLRLERKALGDLTGRVVDDEGAPLAGVRVAAQRSSVERHEATTDAQGGFVLPWLAQAPWDFEAERAGYTLLHWTALSRAEAGGWDPVVLRMTRTGAVEVAVVGPDGAPAKGVTIALGLAEAEAAGQQDLVWADCPGTLAWLRTATAGTLGGSRAATTPTPTAWRASPRPGPAAG